MKAEHRNALTLGPVVAHLATGRQDPLADVPPLGTVMTASKDFGLLAVRDAKWADQKLTDKGRKYFCQGCRVGGNAPASELGSREPDNI